jgi:hypothetical protein
MPSIFATFWDFLKTTEGASLTTAISTIVLTLTTMVYAWLTAILAKENKLLRKAGTEPQVIAYLSPHPRIVGPLQFILANVGQGPAFNVHFRIVSGGQDFASHEAQLLPPKIPLTVLPQGERYDTFFGMGWNMFREPRLLPFSVEVTYRDLSKHERVDTFQIDVGQFDGRVTIGDHPEEELVKAAKEIASEMQKWTSRSLPVETITRGERRREEQEQIDQMRLRREQAQPTRSPQDRP